MPLGRVEYVVPMAAPIDRLVETLTETRAKLEEELCKVEAYRALRQLEQREQTGERLSIVPADQLRQKLEAELAGNHYLNARRKLDEALELLGAWGQEKAQPSAEPAAQAAIADAPSADAAPQGAEPSIPVGVFPMAISAPGLPPDDLTLIRDLPSACVSVVTAAGFGRYQALAGIDARGVAMLERLLGQPGIVARGNWIEQAAILADGRETRYAARLIAKRTGAEWPPAPAEPDLMPPVEIAIAPVVPVAEIPELSPQVPEEVAAAAAEPPATSKPSPSIPFDLTRIRGIDSALSTRLCELGATAFADIAQLTAIDLEGLSQLIGVARERISREGWIEQAAMLESGRLTRYAGTMPVRPPLAPMPYEIVIAAESNPPAEIVEIEAPAPEVVVAATAPEPILIDVPANDTTPPADGSDDSPFWAAATGKAAVLRPVRKSADRTDNAFDDVAALVARTVATARNVGGMRERAKGSVSNPPQAEAPARPPAPVEMAADVVIRSSTSPNSPGQSARRVEPPAPTPVQNPPAARRRLAIEDASVPLGYDPEASIEIRPRVAAPPARPPASEARHPASARRAEPAAQPALGPLARTLVAPRKTLAAKRPAAKGSSNGHGRQTIVIDELAGRRASAPMSQDELAAEEELSSPRLGGLVGRFVKALRGDKAG